MKTESVCTLPGAPIAEFGFVGARMEWERHLYRGEDRCQRCGHYRHPPNKATGPDRERVLNVADRIERTCNDHMTIIDQRRIGGKMAMGDSGRARLAQAVLALVKELRGK